MDRPISASPADIDPSDPIWRGGGYKFSDVPLIVQEYIQKQLKISSTFSELLLPNKRLSVLDFIQSPLPPVSYGDLLSYSVPT